MICAVCEQSNPDDAKLCSRCSSVFPPVRDAAGAAPGASGPGAGVTSDRPAQARGGGVETMAPAPGGRDASATFPSAMVSEGTRLGPRYEIVRLLGKGGMGAVYLAHDRELSRLVAVKLVAQHLAGESWVLERFKREIHLSSIVTHPNVLRVFDLGEHEGLKYLTMQYIEGDTLDGLMRREKRLPVDGSLALFRQLCGALGAAHAKGVLHRDLKPQNVLVDKDRTAYLTDFGLATSQALAPMTQVGAIMGTPHYMSPEQVRGEAIDARSDLFSLGVMLYELLAGERPYGGDSVYSVMMARVRDTARPVRELNPDVPAWLQRVVERCLAVDPAQRYQSADEILADLDAQAVRTRPAARSPTGPRRVARRAGLVAAVLLLVAIPIAAWRLWPRPAAPRAARTVLIADFDNRTGEDVFNGTLEPALGLTLEGASFISSYSRAAAQKVAERLALAGTGLGEGRARLVAQREGISAVVSGFVEKDGTGYRVGARTLDAFTGQKMLEVNEVASDKSGVLAAATKLAAQVRAALGDVTPLALQLRAAETYGAASLEAAHDYAMGMTAQLEGRWDDAVGHYQRALAGDPAMGRAYAGLAVIENNRHRRAEAERNFKLAMSHVDRMSEREKNRTRGAYYLVVDRDPDRAIEALSQLVKEFPADNAGLANLAVAYQLRRDFKQALEVGRRAIAIYPRNVAQRNNVGLFAMYAGDFAAAIQEQQAVLQANPGFFNGAAGLALAQQAAGRRDDAIATWRRLEAGGEVGVSLAGEGLADLAVAEGRFAEARALLEPGIEADLAARNPDGAARKLIMLAEVWLVTGQPARARTAASRALGLAEGEYFRFGAARVLLEAGDEKGARAAADELDARLAPEPRMYAALLRGAAEARHRRFPDAIGHLKAAAASVDAWLVHAALGRTYLEAGAFTEAHAELERCVQRRGEATDLFLDLVPTWRSFPVVLLDLARALDGLHSPAAPEAYRTFLAQRRGGDDPLAADARRRLGGP